MTDVGQKPALAGFIGTILIWILFFLFFYLTSVFFAPKQYKTIKIRLDSPQKTEKLVSKQEKAPVQPSEMQAEQSAPAAAPSKPETPKPEAAKSEPPAAKTSPAKSSQKKSEAKPAPKVERVQQSVAKAQSQPKKTAPQAPLQKSVDELMAEQQQKKAPKKEFDWSQFDEIEGNSSSNSTAKAKNQANNATNQNAFYGNSALASASNTTAASSTSKSSKDSSNQSASSKTTSALSQAISAKPYSSSANGVSSTVTANTGKSSDGKVSIQTSDGTPRILLEPAEPKIVLSKEASALIDSTKRLAVSFTVTAGGNVPVTSVKIHPDVLPSLVSMEIREQISRWRFQSVANDGTARFDYTIQKN